jgi:Flp pilus assembly secretin CpaC
MRKTSILLLFALSLTAYGQYPDLEEGAPIANNGQSDAAGDRLKQLLRSADDLEQAGKSEQAAAIRQKVRQERQSLLARIDSLQAEIERLRQITGGFPQVVTHLKVYEVSLTKLRRLGYNLAKLQGKSVPPPDAVKDTVIGGFSVINDGDEAWRFFESLRKDNLAKVISEPSLVSLSGQKASFTCGGKFPMPKLDKDGTTSVEWEPFGTTVDLLAQVRGRHTIRLSVSFQQSELDHAKAVKVADTSVPGIQVREFTISRELKEGQTLAFSGLNQVHVETSESGIPIASSIPYVGSAFKSVKEERNEIAMFVLVRPEIVESANDAAASPATASPRSDVEIRR